MTKNPKTKTFPQTEIPEIIAELSWNILIELAKVGILVVEKPYVAMRHTSRLLGYTQSRQRHLDYL